MKLCLLLVAIAATFINADDVIVQKRTVKCDSVLAVKVILYYPPSPTLTKTIFSWLLLKVHLHFQSILLHSVITVQEPMVPGTRMRKVDSCAITDIFFEISIFLLSTPFYSVRIPNLIESMKWTPVENTMPWDIQTRNDSLMSTFCRKCISETPFEQKYFIHVTVTFCFIAGIGFILLPNMLKNYKALNAAKVVLKKTSFFTGLWSVP